MLQSGLSVYTYAPPGVPPLVAQYQALDSLSFTTLAPGGFGEIAFSVHVPDARMPQPTLALFNRIAVMAQGAAQGATGLIKAAYLGEITEPIITLDSNNGDSIAVSGLGLGNSLRDDPLSVAYSNQTAKQIVVDQLSQHNRPNMLPLDQDTSLIFPDNPAATYAPVYDGNTMEEVTQDVCVLAGDYMWGVWGHAFNLDQMSFPTGQLVVVKRDTTTIHYQASSLLGDIVSYQVTPQAERAYNVIKIGYNAGNSGYGVATYTDARLGGSGAQGSAPFRRRTFQRDYSGTTTIGSTQATAIANTYGALFQNAPLKVSLTLKAVRDANGNLIPPWLCQAGRNIYVPELAVRGSQFAATPTPGVNQFYIVQTRYDESSDGWTLTLDCDNFADTAAIQVARLQLQADVKQRGGKVVGIFQKQGAAETGYCGYQGHANGAGVTIGQGVNFKALMVQVPSSITLTADGSGIVNVTSATASQIGSRGFLLNVVATASGTTSWHGTYTTVGNTLHRVGPTTHDWHCSRCDTLHKGRKHDLLIVQTHNGGEPGATGLAIQCPRCGMVEAFNTALASEDETSGGSANTHRQGQARLIRQLMRAVGLEALP